MPKHRFTPGSMLLEVLIAATLVGMGLLVVYLGFTNSQRYNVRNASTSIALNLLASQVDSDARVPFDQLTQTNPPLLDITLLPQAVLTRDVQELTDPNAPRVKKVKYIITWQGSQGSQTLATEYVLTENGLLNHGGGS